MYPPLICHAGCHLHSVTKHRNQHVPASTAHVSRGTHAPIYSACGNRHSLRPGLLPLHDIKSSSFQWASSLQQQLAIWLKKPTRDAVLPSSNHAQTRRGLADRAHEPNPTGFVIGSAGVCMFGRKLGAGGFGDVYFGEEIRTQQLVAIKTMDNEVIRSKPLKSRVRVTREISAMMQLRHLNITALYDVAYNPKDVTGKLCMVMEYLPGGTVGEKVRGLKGLGLEEDVARRYFQQLLDAVSFCHEREIAHRDLKPANLLVDDAGRLKVADFGLSAIGVKSYDTLYSVVGTLNYEAPEIIITGNAMDAHRALPGYFGQEADIWSCGVILFYLLAGYPPFSHPSNNTYQLMNVIITGEFKFPSNFPPGAAHLVSQILKVEPGGRIPSREIYANQWFRLDYTPPDYRKILDVKINLEAIDKLFDEPTDPRYNAKPGNQFNLLLPRPATSWKHQDVPADNFTFGSGEGKSLNDEYFVTDETVYSTLPPELIVRALEEMISDMGLTARTRQFTIHISEGHERLNNSYEFNQEPFVVLVDVLSVSDSAHRYMVYFRRATGSQNIFKMFIKHLASKCQHFMVQSADT